MRFAYIILTAIFILTGCTANQPEKISLTVSAAASLNSTLIEIKTLFEEKNKNIEIIYNFSGSGSLQQQIKQGAPVDIFISASKEHFDQLVIDGLIDEKYQTDLLGNSLVLISSKSSNTLITDFNDLKKSNINKIAIGTPETVPAGFYARQALIALDLWEQVEPKLVMAKDVRQVLTYVETGNVPVGLVYATDAKQSNKVDVISISTHLHDPIIYPMGMISSSKKQNEAITFYQYLQSDEARQVFEKSGFIVLE